MQPGPELDSRLRTWIAACRDDPLDPYDNRYVPLDDEAGHLRGDDRKLVLCYRNAEGWYGVHPAVRAHVAAMRARA